jgi:hypothetical protein
VKIGLGSVVDPDIALPYEGITILGEGNLTGPNGDSTSVIIQAFVGKFFWAKKLVFLGTVLIMSCTALFQSAFRFSFKYNFDKLEYVKNDPTPSQPAPYTSVGGDQFKTNHTAGIAHPKELLTSPKFVNEESKSPLQLRVPTSPSGQLDTSQRSHD